MDFIKFVKTELELKRPSIADNTYRQHLTVINKLSAFKSKIPFSHVSVELMQQFKNTLIKDKKDAGAMATAEKIMKIVKQYLGYARNKDYAFKDPFKVIKIKSYKSNRLGLSQEELDRLDRYYNSETCLPHHKKLLRYFLFSCCTGLRISDVSVITWSNIHDDLLIYVPVKTKYQNQSVTMPLLSMDKKYLPVFKVGNAPIFDTFADAVSNRYLKDIAKLSSVDIRKTITYHTSRHTFASLFAEGGDVVALQQLMGHGDIKTTMGYVHTNVKALIDAKRKRFEHQTPAKPST
jgi:integrase